MYCYYRVMMTLIGAKHMEVPKPPQDQSKTKVHQLSYSQLGSCQQLGAMLILTALTQGMKETQQDLN
jgi:hypothetical protein